MNLDVKEKYLLIVREYREKLEQFNKKLEDTPYRCVFNNQLIDEKLLKNLILGIVVMDNPGVDEFLNNEYLIGKAGKGFNKVIKSLSTKENSIGRENLLVFNKSAFYTPSTQDLKELYNDELISQIFLEENRLTFDYIFKIHCLLKVPLMVHGYSNYLKGEKKFIENYKGSRPLYIFFQLLYLNYKNSDLKDLVYFYHHSSYGCLEKQIRDYLDERNFDLYKDLGKYNIKGFFD